MARLYEIHFSDFGNINMPKSSFSLVLFFIILISACVSKPTGNGYMETSEVSPKLNQGKDEFITELMKFDDENISWLEQGFKALADGEHISAVQFFQRHSRVDNTLTADWETSIAIAYVSMLPGSPFYDMKAVRVGYTQLSAWSIDDSSVNSQIILMRDALEAFVSLHRELKDLERDNELLEATLAKRESALRRLRELTLGQQREAAQ